MSWISVERPPPALADTRHSEVVQVRGNDGAPPVLAWAFFDDDGIEWFLDQDDGDLPDPVTHWRPRI